MIHSRPLRLRTSLPLRLLALGLAFLQWGCAGDDAPTLSDDIRKGPGGNAQGGRAAGGGSSGSGGRAQGSSGGNGQGGKAAGGGSSGAAGGGGPVGKGGSGGSSAEGGAGGAGRGGAGQGGAGQGGAGQGGEGQGGEGQGGADTAGAGGMDTAVGGAGGAGPSGGGGKAGGPAATPKSDVEMTFTTANVGRDYKVKAEIVAVFDKIGNVLDAKSGPRFIGWQEIAEADPCGDSCEIDALEARFKGAAGWDTRIPKGKRPDGGAETVKVPITSKGADGSDPSVRAVFASPGWAGVSPTRFVTVVYYPERNVAVVNTHLIAGAWSCKSNPAQRREYWQKSWQVLKAEVAEEHTKGHNVVVTGDLNRARATSECNPAWEPDSLHAAAKVVGGVGIDYIFVVPAKGNKFVVSKKPDGSAKDGDIALGIDGHKAHWISGRFLSN